MEQSVGLTSITAAGSRSCSRADTFPRSIIQAHRPTVLRNSNDALGVRVRVRIQRGRFREDNFKQNTPDHGDTRLCGRGWPAGITVPAHRRGSYFSGFPSSHHAGLARAPGSPRGDGVRGKDRHGVLKHRSCPSIPVEAVAKTGMEPASSPHQQLVPELVPLVCLVQRHSGIDQCVAEFALRALDFRVDRRAA